MAAPLTRIISDLHYRDPGSWVHRLDVLKPLLEGVNTLIVNGDSLDTQVFDQPQELVAELKAFFPQHVPAVTFVTGNHDPDISETHELSLGSEVVWVTHGDVFFDDIAPWGRPVKELRRRIHALAGHLPSDERRRIETRFEIFRQVCLKLPPEHDPHALGTWAKFKRIGNAVFPPHRVLKMLEVWRTFPEIAASFAREQRPRARVVVAGHTHHSGVWQKNGYVVINTGSFCAPRGGQIVDVVADDVRVRRLDRRKDVFSARARHRSVFPRNPGRSRVKRSSMSIEFGWWAKDPDGGKFQVAVAIHGGNIEWTRKQGHHASWQEYGPSEEDWEKLLSEASRRVPRRLISPKQFDEIKRIRDMA